MAEELNDYSGPYKADLTFADFSKDFLLKLMNVWQHAWLHMCMQLPLDNAFTSGLFPGHFEIKSKNLAVMTLSDCQSLRFFEDNDPDRINWVCPNEGKIMEKYLVHPKIKATAIKLPPRKNKDDIVGVQARRLGPQRKAAKRKPSTRLKNI